MSSGTSRSGRQPTSSTSGNRAKSTSREEKNKVTTRKRTKSPGGDKTKLNPPSRKGSASLQWATPLKPASSQALVTSSSYSGVATIGRARTPPDVIKLYGTLGQVVVGRLYRLMLKYNSRHRDSATLSFVPKQPKTFDLRCHKTITPEVLREILPRGLQLECFVIQEVRGLGLKDNHYPFQLKELSSPVTLPRALELSHRERSKLGEATVDQLIWLSKKSNILYLEDYFSVKGREFDRNAYKQQVENKGCQLVGPYGIESGYISEETASKDFRAAINGILPSESETLILDCSLAIVLAFILAYKQVLGSKQLWKLLYESDPKKSPEQRIRMTFDSVDFITWTQRNYIPSSSWKWSVGDLVYIQGPRYGFAFKPTNSRNGSNALVSNTAPLTFRSFKSNGDLDRDKTLENLRDEMMQAFKEPLSHRDVSDIWENLRERPTKLCGAGKSPITWGEVWKSLVDVYGTEKLMQAVTEATKVCMKGGHAPNRDSSPKILVPPQYCEQYVGLTTVQQMYPDDISFN